MGALRVLSVTVVDSTTITATFTENITSTINTTNVSIISNLDIVPNPQVLITSVSGNTLTITTQPLTTQAAYFITFASTPSSPFRSLNGDALLVEDGVTNVILILGPADSNNPVLNFLINYLRDQVYDGIHDSSSFVYKLLQSYAINMARALYDVRQSKNENYLSFTIVDERKIRGSGPFDRLVEEGAYEIDRVGINPTGTNSILSVSFTNFPDNPVSLLASSATDILSLSSNNTTDTFNIDNFVLTVSNHPVIILESVIFTYTDGRLPYTYPIDIHGYQLLNSLYDQEFGFTYLLLQDNQFGLSQSILSDSAFSLNNIFQIIVSYQYKDLGRVINSDNVVITNVLTSAREAMPPIENIFNLQHAPVVDSGGNIETLGGLILTNPNAPNPSTPHPAFLYEVAFNLAALPARPGEYSVDYATGTVYVYGADFNNDGTGPTPPLATYNYLFTYQNNLDYAYDPVPNDIAPIPTGNLLNNSATITFNYEQVLIPNTDYRAEVHLESLSENIENRLIALNALRTLNGPVTDVFRIFNQTSGEVYNLLRWNDNTVYFTYNTPPNITQLLGERVSFQDVINELLFVNQTLTNTGGLSVFKIFLSNNNLTNATADGIGFSLNSTANFSNYNIFQNEIWFDENETEILNIARLNKIGQYQIDYSNGVIYVAVNSGQGLNIGTISYKNSNISPQNPHLISVDDIYYRISLLNPKNKHFTYTNFGNGFILPTNLDVSDEAFLNSNTNAPYEVFNNQIGIFTTGAVFVPGVSNGINFIRGVFEFNDLKNSITPFNFVSGTTFSGQTITLSPINLQQYTTINFDGTNHYVQTNLDLPYLSPGITLAINVVRLSDSANLWSTPGTVVLGNGVRLILSGAHSPQTGDAVVVNYTLFINALSRVIVDYNKGDLFIDYTYLADEIEISYEYGDNVIDFRQSETVSANEVYYVTYKVGALRNALINNFGSLINVPALTSVDINLPRERYRDALSAALSSFLQGPTITAMTNLVEQISHVKPQITESIFQNWSLGSSLLNPRAIETTGTLQLLPAKFGNGVLIDTLGQTITFPVSSNLRIEQGSFQTWVSPHWNGLDNDADLTVTITKDGLPIPSDQVFLGAAENHPQYNFSNSFTTNKRQEVQGLPNLNKDGVYLYYAPDASGLFNRWYLEVVDGYSDGYNDGYSTAYTIKITTDGKFYDVRSVISPQPTDLQITSGVSTATFVFRGPVPLDVAATFLADFDHYLLDFGIDKNKNRLSIYKDPSGYFNFRVFDNDGRAYSVSADVSKWKINDLHHIATSWILNSKNGRDELHLFIDGFEVPNVIKYGNRIGPYPHELFRTVDPEEIAGAITNGIVSSTDLVTTAGSTSVSSSINFSQYGVVAPTTIFINEPGFAPAGYTVLTVSGQTLILNTAMPSSITNGKFSVNPTSLPVRTEIDIFPNFAVSTISASLSGSDLNTVSGSTTVSSTSINFTTHGVIAGYLLRIDGNPTLQSHYNILMVSGNTLTLDSAVSLSLTNAIFHIYPNIPVEIPGLRAVNPSYTLTKDANFNNVLTITNNAHTNDLIHITTLGINHRRIRQPYYQWGGGTTIDVGSNGQMLPQATIFSIHVVSTAGFPTSGSLYVFTDKGFQLVSYTGLTSNIFTGCTGGIGTMSTGGTVSGGSTVIATHLPIPVALAGVNVFHEILPNTIINSSNSTLILNNFTSNALTTDQPSTSVNGRTLSVTINSTNNINFSTPVSVTINGMPSSETINFTSLGTQNSVNKYTGITSIVVSGMTNNTSKAFMTLFVEEEFSITVPENSNANYPIIRYSYQIDAGTTLSGSGTNVVTDLNSFFSSPDINNYLVISSPLSVAGTYQITGISADHHSLTLATSLPSFSGGFYQILNASDFRSGFQSGFFFFEQTLTPGQPYPLAKGRYDFDYYTYLSVKLDPINEDAFLGTDFNSNNVFNGLIDALKSSSIKLTDTRIGETIPSSQESITKDFNSLKPLKDDVNTIMLTTFDTFPFTNDARYYVISQNTGFVQAGFSVNSNFNQSVYITDKPLVIDNAGILNTKQQGTIEFWINPIFDTGNDPNYRYYFDASGITIENVISINDTAVQVAGNVGQVLSVKLQHGDQSIDYFDGGSVGFDTSGAISENTTSLNTNTVIVSQSILQVISVKIIGDPTGTNYFNKGTIGTDGHTIFLDVTLPQSSLPVVIIYKPTSAANKALNRQVIKLKKRLPAQNTPVTVSYIPSGLQGDRISIYKDPSGYVNFSVIAGGIEYKLRGQTFWSQGTWHRVKATYSFNSGTPNDEIRLFIDGYERGNLTLGSGLLFGDPHIAGATTLGIGGLTAEINFKDTFNDLYVGSQFNGQNSAFALIDNFRISNIARPLFTPFGESIDVNYNSNLNVVFPVTQDLYTTLLLDFNTLVTLNQDFAVLLKNGSFDFTVNVFDSFDILLDNPQAQNVLEALIEILKPANSSAFITYTR